MSLPMEATYKSLLNIHTIARPHIKTNSNKSVRDRTEKNYSLYLITVFARSILLAEPQFLHTGVLFTVVKWIYFITSGLQMELIEIRLSPDPVIACKHPVYREGQKGKTQENRGLIKFKVLFFLFFIRQF